MNRTGSLELDSYRLAAYTVPCPCYVCGGGNNFDSELCRHCYAPMALAHQAASQRICPRMVAAIGPSGAGKTVYLGMLTDMLSRQTEPMQLLARGAFSIALQQTTMAALSRCEFPNKTPNEPDRWNWVHCQVLRKHKRPAELIMPDLAGESPGFVALCIFQSEGIDHIRRCILSVTPESGASLEGLGELLDNAESERRIEVHGVDNRVQDPVRGEPLEPRPGYRNADPWYDGRSHHYTILDSPRSGTLLTVEEIERLFLRFGRCREGDAQPVVGGPEA